MLNMFKSKKMDTQVEEAMEALVALQLTVGEDDELFKEKQMELGKLVIKQQAVRGAKIAAVTALGVATVYGVRTYLVNKYPLDEEGEEA